MGRQRSAAARTFARHPRSVAHELAPGEAHDDVAGCRERGVTLAITLELPAVSTVRVPAVAFEHHGRPSDQEVDLVAEDDGVELHRRQPEATGHVTHRRLEDAVDRLVVDHELVERGAERGHAVAATPRVHIAGGAQGPRGGDRVGDDVEHRFSGATWVDRPHVAPEPKDVARRDVPPQHGRQVLVVARAVDDDAVESEPTGPTDDDDVDRVVVRSRDVPQVGGAAMRRHRPRRGGEHSGSDALLASVGTPVQPGDVRVDRFEPAAAHGAVPGRCRHPGASGGRPRHEAVMVEGEQFEALRVHAPPGRRHLARTEVTDDLVVDVAGIRERPRPDRGVGTTTPRLRGGGGIGSPAMASSSPRSTVPRRRRRSSSRRRSWASTRASATRRRSTRRSARS